MSPEFIWILARATGVASLVALTIATITGVALRPQTLRWLSTNRAVSELHEYTTWLWAPLGAAHVVAILLDPYAKVGLADLIVPFGVDYARLQIGLGTISVQLLIVVMVAAYSRKALSHREWLAFHRISYVAFAAMFLHSVLSGTDLAYPWLAGIAWLVVAITIMATLRRWTHGVLRGERVRVDR